MTSEQVEAFLKRTTPQERVGAVARDVMSALRSGEAGRDIEWIIGRMVDATSKICGWEFVSVKGVEDYRNHGLEDLPEDEK